MIFKRATVFLLFLFPLLLALAEDPVVSGAFGQGITANASAAKTLQEEPETPSGNLIVVDDLRQLGRDYIQSEEGRQAARPPRGPWNDEPLPLFPECPRLPEIRAGLLVLQHYLKNQREGGVPDISSPYGQLPWAKKTPSQKFYWATLVLQNSWQGKLFAKELEKICEMPSNEPLSSSLKQVHSYLQEGLTRYEKTPNNVKAWAEANTGVVAYMHQSADGLGKILAALPRGSKIPPQQAIKFRLVPIKEILAGQFIAGKVASNAWYQTNQILLRQLRLAWEILDSSMKKAPNLDPSFTSGLQLLSNKIHTMVTRVDTGGPDAADRTISGCRALAQDIEQFLTR